jgi:predicted membrane protein
LAQGVEDLQLLYGYSDLAGTNPGAVVNFLRADEISSLVLPASAIAAGITSPWEKVIAVRVQLLMRSQENVLDQDAAVRTLADFNSQVAGTAVAAVNCSARGAN